MHRFLFLLLLLLMPGLASALKPGEAAPDFSGVKIADGSNLRLSALRGKVVYIDFWASWCAPCRVSLPLLDRMHSDLAGQGFEVLGINVDADAEVAKRVLAAAGVEYQNLRGVAESTLQAYGIEKMPAAFLLDRQGRVHSVHQGFRPSEFPALRAGIEKLVEEKSK
jgi:thiol-disulfide isomerase/thioredoxin